MASIHDTGPVMLIGAGKMGLALAQGWLDAGLPPSNLVLIDPSPTDASKALAEDYGLVLNAEPYGLQPNVLVLAVKPQIINDVMATLGPVIGSHTIGVSIAAGIDINRLSRGLGTDRVVRTMPNTPSQIGKGVTGAVAGEGLSSQDRAVVDALLAASGSVFWFDAEKDLDIVTAVSGSGPAYVFYLVEALAAAAQEQGLPEHIAAKLARETIIGAAGLLEADPVPASVLRQNVTSPNGTTAAGLAELMSESGLQPIIHRTVEAARRRSEELGRN